MPKFAANLSLTFNEVPFLDRFAIAAGAGFEAVEYLFPYEYEPAELTARLQSNGQQQVLFNGPPGDWAAGERGIAAQVGREDEFRASVDVMLRYARALSCPTVHVMAGLVAGGMDTRRAVDTYVANLQYACDRFAPHGITAVIEPLNPTDFPGYLASKQAHGRTLIERIDRPNMGLQLDLYHTQMGEGGIAAHIREFLPITRHIQIAGVPGRHEPDVGEINYPFLFDLLDELGYTGWIGCEYRPQGDTLAGLGWLARCRAGR